MPPFLRPGDTIGVVAPASRFPYEELAEGLRILREDWKLTVIEGDSLHAVDGPFAGSDDLRRSDIQRLFDNPDCAGSPGRTGRLRLLPTCRRTRFNRHSGQSEVAGGF